VARGGESKKQSRSDDVAEQGDKKCERKGDMRPGPPPFEINGIDSMRADRKQKGGEAGRPKGK